MQLCQRVQDGDLANRGSHATAEAIATPAPQGGQYAIPQKISVSIRKVIPLV
jgi:hypothetical protein